MNIDERRRAMTEAEYTESEIDQVLKEKEGLLIFVTIGVPFSSVPIMQKVMTYVEPTTDTPVTAAKKLRKMVADNIENYNWVPGTNFTPAELYYEIYVSSKSLVPIRASSNSRFWRDANGVR